MPVPSQIVFVGIVLLLVIQRLLELRHSRRNEALLFAQGGREHAPGHFRFMTLVHTLWFLAMLGEVLILDRRLDRPSAWIVAGFALAATCMGQALRYAAIRTLGARWSVRIVTVPNAPAVAGGIYRYIRHPNYLGVILEIAAVPLLHGAFLTAIVFSLANALVLAIRIRAEETALRQENDYSGRMQDRPRFVPGRAPRAPATENLSDRSSPSQ
jgi:methyltransferase